MLSSAFYRNKAAYVVGKVINGYRELPFVVPVLNDGRELSLDTIVLDEEQLNVLFSLSRAYCMVDMAVPAGYVRFLRRMMPTKTRGRPLHDARPRQAGEDALLPRPAPASPPLA